MAPSPLLTIRGWVFDKNSHLIGVVVELPDESWRYRQFDREDVLDLPTPTVKLVTVLRRYLDAAGPDGAYPPGPSL